MTGYRISDIAVALSAQLCGDGDLVVQGAREPGAAGPADLAIAMSPKYRDALAQGNARAAILWDGADWQSFGLEAAIFVGRPRLAMAALTAYLKPAQAPDPGVHATAVVAASASLAKSCSIGPFVVIGSNVTVGANTCIGAQSTIGQGVSIGADCTLGAGVRIQENVRIGKRFVAHPGVVIGADGFSFATAEKSPAEAARENFGDTTAGQAGQKWHKIHALGGVRIGDDVEVGANSNIDAGTIRATTIGDGTKIDALVQVGHNVRIGKNCLLCAHVAVGGSALLGDDVVLGGQAGVADNITIGDGVIAGGGSKILSNVPAGRAILGYPAVKMARHIEGYRALYRLPRLLKDIARAKKPVPKDGAKP